jgi:hypothetical protein
MIYVDSIRHYPDCGLPYKDWCHMATDGDLSELHAMARQLGLRRAWFQDKPGTPHYDLTPRKRAQSLVLGAQAVDTMELARRCFPHLQMNTPSHARGGASSPSVSPPEQGATHIDESSAGALLRALLQRDTVRCLTMTDPWGSLVASSAKRIETRTWGTSYQGPLAIHIAKGLPSEAEDLCALEPFRQALIAAGFTRNDERRHNVWGLPLGQVVAVVWLEEVRRITLSFQVEEPERSFGNYRLGRYAWHFESVYRLSMPLPTRGSLGVWEWQPPAHFWSEVQTAYDRVREEAQR